MQLPPIVHPTRIAVVVAGATGWVGSALVPAILAAPDLQLVGAVARRHAGQDVGTALGRAAIGVTMAATVAEALSPSASVLVDFTSPLAVRGHIAAALDRGVHVVVGTSGLDPGDDAALDARARACGCGVVAAGNFSLVATLAKRLALMAAAEMPGWEVLDYAAPGKPDAPSGTAFEWAAALGAAHPRPPAAPAPQAGQPRARGATIAGVQVHSVRLPGYVLSTALLAGSGDERLTIRYDAGQSPAPYLAGTLLAIRRVGSLSGLVRGLDQLLS